MNPVTSDRSGSHADADATGRARLLCALAAVIAGVLYINALQNPFIYDDYRIIVENRKMADPLNLPVVIGRDATRPVATISYAIDRATWGSGPFGFHVTNVLLHMINVGLFGWLAWRLARDASVSRPNIVLTVAAFVFAVHPMLSGAVGYISARPEVLSATFVLLAVLSARRWLLRRGGLWLGVTVVLWLAAMATKETAALLPVILLACDRWILRPEDAREARRRFVWMHVPLFSLAAVVVAVRLFVFILVEQGGTIDFQWPLVFVELDVVRRYATMLLLPTGQSIYHAVMPIDGILQLRTALNAAAFAAIAALIWTQRRARPLLSFGLLWFGACLIPSSLLVMLNRGEPMAEHRVYLASCGAFLVAGLAVERAWTFLGAGQRVTRIICGAALVAIVATLAGRTFLRNVLWQRPLLVWLDAAEAAPNDWLPHRVLGEELHRAGKHSEAVAAFTRAIDLAPAEVSAYGKLGVCLSELGDLNAADAAFTRMQALDRGSPEASNGLATVALLRGNLAEAKRGYMRTLALDDENLAARRGLIVVEEAPGGNPADALRWCQEVKILEPTATDVDACIARNKAKLGGGRDNGR